MRRPKPGPKPTAKKGSISGKDARSQAIEAAKIAAKKNEGKIKVRIDHRTEIMVDPDQYYANEANNNNSGYNGGCLQ